MNPKKEALERLKKEEQQHLDTAQNDLEELRIELATLEWRVKIFTTDDLNADEARHLSRLPASIKNQEELVSHHEKRLQLLQRH